MFKKHDDRCYVIYKHQHKINKKIYIGMTCDIDVRWGINGSGYTSDPYSLFGRAVKKYGWDAFTHEIIECNLTWEEANEREQYYIALYKCNIVRYPELNAGYNLTDGGCGTKGHPLSEGAKQKLSLRNSGEGNPRWGAKLSQSTKAKISTANKGRWLGEKSPLWGKPRHLSPEVQAKLHAPRPKVAGANNPRARSVVCLETGTIYATVKDAALAVGCNYNNIIRVCKGKQLTAAGLHWKYSYEADAEASA